MNFIFFYNGLVIPVKGSLETTLVAESPIGLVVSLQLESSPLKLSPLIIRIVTVVRERVSGFPVAFTLEW